MDISALFDPITENRYHNINEKFIHVSEISEDINNSFENLFEEETDIPYERFDIQIKMILIKLQSEYIPSQLVLNQILSFCFQNNNNIASFSPYLFHLVSSIKSKNWIYQGISYMMKTKPEAFLSSFQNNIYIWNFLTLQFEEDINLKFSNIQYPFINSTDFFLIESLFYNWVLLQHNSNTNIQNIYKLSLTEIVKQIIVFLIDIIQKEIQQESPIKKLLALIGILFPDELYVLLYEKGIPLSLICDSFSIQAIISKLGNRVDFSIEPIDFCIKIYSFHQQLAQSIIAQKSPEEHEIFQKIIQEYNEEKQIFLI